jgi:hypothetical protein
MFCSIISEVFLAASAARMARLRTSSATTANPGPGLSGPGRLHRRVQGQKVGLEGDLVDGLDDLGGFVAKRR